ncbi:hypothetical protein ACKWTF_012543 [Chironomus riparius]
MSIFETSSELFDDSDVTSQSTFTSFSSISSISSSSISNSSNSSDDNSMAGSTRRGRMGNLFSQSSGSSSDNQNNIDSPTSTSDSDSSMASTNQLSESEVSNNSSRSSQTSDTEPYDVDEEMARTNNDPIIEINDSQLPNNVQDDDDVILIPQNIETIDLCTQALVVPRRLRNEVIDITDSPGIEISHAGPVRRRRSRVNVTENPVAPSPQRPTTSTPNARQQLNLDDSLNDSQPKITLTCPICLDTVVNRTPVSTLCGHIFCQTCIVQALGNAKKCPMCKKALNARKPYFNIFLPC